LRFYGSEHPKLPRLAYDVALLWLEQGRFRAALEVLPSLLRLLSGAEERLRVTGALARAAGACRDAVTFALAWDLAWAQAERAVPETAQAIPAVLVEVGLGAASLHQWERAEQAFTLALRRAEETAQFDTIARAEAGLASAKEQERVPVNSRPSSQAVMQLAEALVRVLDAVPEGGVCWATETT
jgi:tetratricopeptide (TPR) repeat protein